MTGESNGTGERAILKRLKLSGFRSIKEMDLELGPVNVLIGGNGSGKSNLLSFFRLLVAIRRMSLEEAVIREGGASQLLHYGPKKTEEIEAKLTFEGGRWAGVHEVKLVHQAPQGLTVVKDYGHPKETSWTALVNEIRWGAYHFNDTGPTSPIHGQCYIHDNHELASDARNLSAYLYMLRETRPEYYDRIVATIRLAVPFFGDFELKPLEVKPDDIMLDWQERESEYTFRSNQLSDGALRFAAVATLLLQPEKRLPWLIAIDEPELGLHPYALEVIANLLSAVSVHTQVIVATQSAALVDFFDPEQVIVVDRKEGESTFTRLKPEALRGWLEDYTLSELWEKNVIGGRPAR